MEEAVKSRYTDGLWTRFFFSVLNTRLAFPWTRLFVAAGMSPNQVSILSLLVSIAGMVFVALPTEHWHPWLGAGLLMVGIWWDHSDGQVARLTGKESMQGALLDTIFDRWIEAGWLLAIGIGLLLSDVAQARAWPAWVVLFVVVSAVFSNLYLRWSNIQKDLYLLRDALLRADAKTPGERIVVSTEKKQDGPNDVRMFYIPFAFNRDVSFWMLAVITCTPYWVEGLFIFAALHAARGLEKNWYTFQGLRHRKEAFVADFVDSDYHK